MTNTFCSDSKPTPLSTPYRLGGAEGGLPSRSNVPKEAREETGKPLKNGGGKERWGDWSSP